MKRKVKKYWKEEKNWQSFLGSSGFLLEIIEPSIDEKRKGIVEHRLRKAKFNLEEIKSKLRAIRLEATEKIEENIKNIGAKSNKFFKANDCNEAVGYISEIANGTKKILVNNSSTVREIIDGLEKEGFEIIDTYKADIGKVEKKFYWQIPKISHELIWSSFDKGRANEVKESPYCEEECIGLIGVNAISCEPLSFFLLQHLNNIKKIMSEAKKIFFIVGIDKLLKKYEDAYFQTKCCALFGFNAIAQECSNNNISTLDRTIKKKKVDDKEVHLILLDNGRSELLNGKFKELLYCINCRACSELCATLSLPKESLFKAILQKKGIYDCTLCGACKDLCPLQISIPEFILEIRKKSSLSDVHKKMCKSIEKYDNPFGEEKKQRSMFYTKKFEKREGIQIYFGCVASYQ
ncbi:MAG: hypothetical protein AB1779_09455, partial [Candidatus Thermoplasmatota archaeon]